MIAGKGIEGNDERKVILVLRRGRLHGCVLPGGGCLPAGGGKKQGDYPEDSQCRSCIHQSKICSANKRKNTIRKSIKTNSITAVRSNICCFPIDIRAIK